MIRYIVWGPSLRLHEKPQGMDIVYGYILVLKLRLGFIQSYLSWCAEYRLEANDLCVQLLIYTSSLYDQIKGSQVRPCALL